MVQYAKKIRNFGSLDRFSRFLIGGMIVLYKETEQTAGTTQLCDTGRDIDGADTARPFHLEGSGGM